MIDSFIFREKMEFRKFNNIVLSWSCFIFSKCVQPNTTFLWIPVTLLKLFIKRANQYIILIKIWRCMGKCVRKKCRGERVKVTASLSLVFLDKLRSSSYVSSSKQHFLWQDTCFAWSGVASVWLDDKLYVFANVESFVLLDNKMNRGHFL